ncbi:glutamate-1-semialdehyde 2,1-aminomutase [Sinorhizobium fredii]|uniref:Glutamate-1-semialdehyde 2,1-aminomutase n=1 Tax=Sinorhizobium fredii (strain USDA 257) TaxID=1185652 RepID=I3X3F9_SINF2|nr:aminotransferase class III-fold pyridoxal phosphate-dependent enzyme [Sinorhizobium fredii]AFL50415.1 glutamate-1-semialdehyde 2,1-aminomutase [Sinorhizobium fredii USDA 257]
MRLNGNVVDELNRSIDQLRREFAQRNPLSERAALDARRVLPGGNTRSVLFYEPFPLTILSGKGADITDLDGHSYADFVGEFSAGLYGHSDAVIRKAIIDALDDGTVLAGPNRYEAKFAESLQSRFPSMELLRFCNSGTEANILALVTAQYFTRRRKIMVFEGAYHGGVLVFPIGGSPINVPFDFIVAPYNDGDAAAKLIKENQNDLAAVIVEPILGAGGNLPGTTDFFSALRRETEAVGTLLIFDEVKTSRCGAAGMQGRIGIRPDLTTLGKYLGGGLPIGAFGGRTDIMDHYNPYKPDSLRHAGTFNNNVCTMAAGLAGLTKVFTPERADVFHEESERLRLEFQRIVDLSSVPLCFTGLGSLCTLHLAGTPLQEAADVTPLSRRVGLLFHMYGLLNGVAVAGRGDFYQSLPMTAAHRQAASAVLAAFVGEYGELISSLAEENARALPRSACLQRISTNRQSNA